MNKWMNEWMNEWKNEWMNEWMNEWRKNEKTNKQTNKPTNKQTNELMNERVIKSTKESDQPTSYWLTNRPANKLVWPVIEVHRSRQSKIALLCLQMSDEGIDVT